MLELLLIICLFRPGISVGSTNTTSTTAATVHVIDDDPEPVNKVVVDDGVPF
jgi:hypothetical protein